MPTQPTFFGQMTDFFKQQAPEEIEPDESMNLLFFKQDLGDFKSLFYIQPKPQGFKTTIRVQDEFPLNTEENAENWEADLQSRYTQCQFSREGTIIQADCGQKIDIPLLPKIENLPVLDTKLGELSSQLWENTLNKISQEMYE